MVWQKQCRGLFPGLGVWLHRIWRSGEDWTVSSLTSPLMQPGPAELSHWSDWDGHRPITERLGPRAGMGRQLHFRQVFSLLVRDRGQMGRFFSFIFLETPMVVGRDRKIEGLEDTRARFMAHKQISVYVDCSQNHIVICKALNLVFTILFAWNMKQIFA